MRAYGARYRRVYSSTTETCAYMSRSAVATSALLLILFEHVKNNVVHAYLGVRKIKKMKRKNRIEAIEKFAGS